MKRLLTLLLLSIHLISFSQTEKKKVLVVLYDRVDFSTDYSLNEIARINLIKASEVYDSLVNLLMASLSKLENDSISFVKMLDGENNYLKSKVTKSYVKSPARYSASLSDISNKEFNYLLSKNDADYVLFVNFYQFTETRVSDEERKGLELLLSGLNNNVGMRGNAKKYASQLVDFEVFGKNKELVFVKGRYVIPTPGINEKNYFYEGKDFQTIEVGYVRYSKWLAKELNAKTK